MLSKLIRVFLLIGVLVLNVRYSLSSSTSSNGTGNWNNSGTWSNGVPTCGDTIIISVGHTVTITSHVNLDESSSPACSTAMYVEVRGTLQFNSGKKLYLACGSVVYITGDGELKKGSGGGNSNLIEECGSTIWNAGDGDLSGPQYVGSGLPIILKYFRAESDLELVRFNWLTLSEINNDYFTIEHSMDLYEIIEVQRVEGAGNSREERHYEASCDIGENGIHYYRLKQTDFDGSTSHSDWQVINVDARGSKIMVFPTLVQSHFFIQLFNMEGQRAELFLSDASGSIIYSEHLNIKSNDAFWSSENKVHGLKGNAIVSIVGEGAMLQQKLIFK